MRNKIFLPLVFFALAGITFASAQSNELMDKLLSEKEALFGDAALFVLTAGGVLTGQAAVNDALKYISKNYSRFPGKSAGSPITASEFSFLLMKTLKLKGGIMYMLIPGPRYAYRELVYRKAISPKGGPYRRIAGEDIIRTLRNVLDAEEAEK